jgi:ABC-type branched-subunit amino acid transport system substrate-binding protein
VSFALRICFVVLLVAVGGCASFHHLDDYSTRPEEHAETPAVATEPSSASLPIPGGCATHRDCEQAACVQGACVPLRSSDCTRTYGDLAADAIIVGAITSGADERAIVLAAEEVAPATRPLVVVACDAGTDVLRATKHLTDDLRVPAIIGPSTADDVVTATQQAGARAGTLIMTASSASPISNLADENLTWRNVPSDVQRAKLVIQQLNELETLLKTIRGTTTVKLGVVHASDAEGVSARDSIAGKLILNGRFISDAANASNVSIDAYDDVAGASAIAARYAAGFVPDFVFLSSAAEIESFLVPLEQALTAARVVQRPYYVCGEGVKTAGLLAALSAPGMPADLKRRIRGVGPKPEISSAPILADFVRAFTTRWGAPLGVAGSVAVARAAAAYDATYAIAYAMVVGTGSVSGAAVARGLRALGVGEAMTVGAKSAMQVASALRTSRSVALRGTYAPMEWDLSGDVRAGALEVWCIGGTSASTATFGSSGLTMDVANQVIGGSFVQCQ